MDKYTITKIDGGNVEDRLNEAKRLFGLTPEQSFQDIETNEED